MLPSTLDMAPSPSKWNPRPSTLDKKIDSKMVREQGGGRKISEVQVTVYYYW